MRRCLAVDRSISHLGCPDWLKRMRVCYRLLAKAFVFCREISTIDTETINAKTVTGPQMTANNARRHCMEFSYRLI
jgi:hypothetical protein